MVGTSREEMQETIVPSAPSQVESGTSLHDDTAGHSSDNTRVAHQGRSPVYTLGNAMCEKRGISAVQEPQKVAVRRGARTQQCKGRARQPARERGRHKGRTRLQPVAKILSGGEYGEDQGLREYIVALSHQENDETGRKTHLSRECTVDRSHQIGGDSDLVGTCKEKPREDMVDGSQGKSERMTPDIQNTGNPKVVISDETLSKEGASGVRVYLLQSIHLLPGQSAFSCVKTEVEFPPHEPLLIECDRKFGQMMGLNISDALVQLEEDDAAQILAANLSGFTQTLEQGASLGSTLPVTVETPKAPVEHPLGLHE